MADLVTRVQRFDIGDTHDVISVECVQHQKVRVWIILRHKIVTFYRNREGSIIQKSAYRLYHGYECLDRTDAEIMGIFRENNLWCQCSTIASDGKLVCYTNCPRKQENCINGQYQIMINLQIWFLYQLTFFLQNLEPYVRSQFPQLLSVRKLLAGFEH